jgi:hypothetical protein
MGAPTSGLLAEFFLQHLEHLHISHLSDKHKIIKLVRYVDDILIIYDTNHTDVQNIPNDFNTIHSKLKFTAECDINNQIYFLDITVHRTPTNWNIAVYRKPTFTNTIIPYTSNHPTQHKYATIQFLYNRLNTYDLLEDDYNAEVTTIQNILFNNAFPIHSGTPTTPHPPRTKPKNRQPQHTRPTQHKNGLLSLTLAKKPLSLLIYLRRPT